MSRAKNLHDYLTTPEARERNKHLLGGENNLPAPLAQRERKDKGLAADKAPRDTRKPLKTPLSVHYKKDGGSIQLCLQGYSAKSLNHFKNNWQRKNEREYLYNIILAQGTKRYLKPPDHKQLITITRILGPGQRIVFILQSGFTFLG